MRAVRAALGLHGDGSQRLADAVVQLAGDAQALLLLRGQGTPSAAAAFLLEAIEHGVERLDEGRDLGVGVVDPGEPTSRIERVDRTHQRGELLQGESARRSRRRVAINIATTAPTMRASCPSVTGALIVTGVRMSRRAATTRTTALARNSRSSSSGRRLRPDAFSAGAALFTVCPSVPTTAGHPDGPAIGSRPPLTVPVVTASAACAAACGVVDDESHVLAATVAPRRARRLAVRRRNGSDPQLPGTAVRKVHDDGLPDSATQQRLADGRSDRHISR
jgi:hypothetical protein